MSYIIGTGTFTNGSSTVTSVSITQSSLALISSGTNISVGFDPVVGNVEATGLSGSDITLRNNWTGTTGSYAFVAWDTVEGLQDAIQAAKGFSDALQTATAVIGTPSTTADPDTVAKRDASARLEAAAGVSGDDVLTIQNRTTSSTDTTAGRVLQVGADEDQFSSTTRGTIEAARAGNIGLDTLTETTADLDTITKTGFYRLASSNANIPLTEAGNLIVNSRLSGFTMQIWQSVVSDRMFFRRNFSSTWQPWQELYHTGNTGVTSYTNSTPTAGTNSINFGETAGIIGLSRPGTSTTNVMVFVNDNGVVGSVQTNGTATSYNTASDNDLKTNFEKPSDELIESKMQDIYDCFTLFDWKNGCNDEKVWGFLAWNAVDKGLDFATDRKGPRDMEIGEVYQEATYDGDGNELTPELRVEPGSVDQSKLTPYLVADNEKKSREIKTLQQENSELKSQLAALTQRLDAAGL